MIVENVVKTNKTNYTKDSSSEKPIRSVAKAISWRVVGTLDTLFVSYFVLGQGEIEKASAIAGIDFITKMLLYFFHERTWNKIKWGR